MNNTPRLAYKDDPCSLVATESAEIARAVRAFVEWFYQFDHSDGVEMGGDFLEPEDFARWLLKHHAAVQQLYNDAGVTVAP